MNLATRPGAAPGSTAPRTSDASAPTVALMGRSLRGQYNGVARYTQGLVTGLSPVLRERLHLFLTRAEHGLNDQSVSLHHAPFRTPNEYTRAFWEQCVVPFDVGRLAPDVFHSPNYILPAAIRCPSVVTVHDTAFLDRSLHRLRSHLYLTVLTAIALKKASRIVSVSNYTRDLLVRRFPGTASRIRVVGEGVAEQFRPQPDTVVDRFLQRYRLRSPYVLFVGTFEPRKNISRLIRAFERATLMSNAPHELVLIGGSGWKNTDVRQTFSASPLRERIRILGYVQDDDLPAAYTGADLFVYPSLQEGFGLPPLEAMACGVPVITSSSSALAEVAGAAAETVDPSSEDDLADAIAAVLNDESRQEALRSRGYTHAARFRWNEVADQMLAVYAEAAR